MGGTQLSVVQKKFSVAQKILILGHAEVPKLTGAQNILGPNKLLYLLLCIYIGLNFIILDIFQRILK
jgi:hypothetical protein